MKLNEMSNALQERYQLEQDKKRKEEETTKKEAKRANDELKVLITDLIHSIQYELENNLTDTVYEAYENACNRVSGKKEDITICCWLEDNCIEFCVRINGYRSDVFTHSLGFCGGRDLDGHLARNYGVEQGFNIFVELFFSLSKNTVTLCISGIENLRSAINDLKKIFPDASVRKVNGEGALTIKFKLQD